MTRGLSSAITTELQNQNIKPIILLEILFPTPQRITFEGHLAILTTAS